MTERQVLQRPASLWAAVLMVISLLTGVFVSAAMTGKVHADPHSALASHLNAFGAAIAWAYGLSWPAPSVA